MSDDLVERVARVICCANEQCYRPDKCFSWSFTGEATAAIALALEEAATIIERRATIRHGYDAHFDAVALRAMIPKEPRDE